MYRGGGYMKIAWVRRLMGKGSLNRNLDRLFGKKSGRLAVYAGILVALAPILSSRCQAAAPNKNQVTILYDAFGKPSELKKDWGYSALVEYGGKRILFDTGNNAEFFKHNVETLGIDLRNLDFVVISHRHGAINQHDATLPSYMHYYDGEKQESRPSGSPWPTAHFKQIDGPTEVAPGIFIVSN